MITKYAVWVTKKTLFIVQLCASIHYATHFKKKLDLI